MPFVGGKYIREKERILDDIQEKREKKNKEINDKIIDLVAKGKQISYITIHLHLSAPTIHRRLKDMGFDGIKDARRVMLG